jgi:diaminohydroxyphosphoribosylaminopyrimidine deaminase/5-amino-6-(5-phosphoribosylamino)uracil reductase
LDPNPKVSGQGVRLLRQGGVNVEVGLCEREARLLNEVFFHFITQGVPFAKLKLAVTLDGKIATRSGSSKWITGERSRREVHRLRYESDAILVGIGTLLQDDPSLDVRWIRNNSITKIVLDTQLRTPVDSKLFHSDDRVLIFHGDGVQTSRRRALEGKAVLISVPDSEEGVELKSVFEELGRLSIGSVLIEGGSSVAASAVRSGHVSKIALFYGPRLIGGDGLSSLGDLGVIQLEESPCIRDLRIRRLGSDFLVEGYL